MISLFFLLCFSPNRHITTTNVKKEWFVMHLHLWNCHSFPATTGENGRLQKITSEFSWQSEAAMLLMLQKFRSKLKMALPLKIEFVRWRQGHICFRPNSDWSTFESERLSALSTDGGLKKIKRLFALKWVGGCEHIFSLTCASVKWRLMAFYVLCCVSFVFHREIW